MRPKEGERTSHTYLEEEETARLDSQEARRERGKKLGGCCKNTGDKWIEKLMYRHTIDYYSAKKRMKPYDL